MPPAATVLQRPEARHDLERRGTCDTRPVWNTGRMSEISVRAPMIGRIWAFVFWAGVSAALINASVQDYLHGKVGAVAAFWVTVPVCLLAIFAGTLATRSFRADASGLVVRNYLVARRFPISQVLGFDVGPRTVLSPSHVRVLTTQAGAVPIRVYHYFALFRRDKDRIADELNASLESARAGAAPG